MSRLAAAAVVAGAVAALTACGWAANASPGASSREPARIGGYWPSPGRRTLRLEVERSACSRDLRLVALRQGARSVGVAFDARRLHPNRPCPLFLRIECASVVLERPLGSRAVFDARSGHRVGRVSLRRPTVCPRARRR